MSSFRSASTGSPRTPRHVRTNTLPSRDSASAASIELSMLTRTLADFGVSR